MARFHVYLRNELGGRGARVTRAGAVEGKDADEVRLRFHQLRKLPLEELIVEAAAEWRAFTCACGFQGRARVRPWEKPDEVRPAHCEACKLEIRARELLFQATQFHDKATRVRRARDSRQTPGGMSRRVRVDDVRVPW